MRRISAFLVCILVSVLFVHPIGFCAPMATSTTLPTGTVNFLVFEVDSKNTQTATDDTWNTTPVSSLNFGALNAVTVNLPAVGGGTIPGTIFLPQYYFAIETAVSGGGAPTGFYSKTVQVNYVDTASPNPGGLADGLGERSTVTYTKTVVQETAPGSGVFQTVDSVPLKYILDGTTSRLLSAVQGGWLRMYVGVATKDPTAVPADPAAVKLFTPADVQGTYSGTLTVTLL